MTIRFTCDKCGSVLKIKDELAGSDGKCPKCKTKFVVPQPGVDESASVAALVAAADAPEASQPVAAPPTIVQPPAHTDSDTLIESGVEEPPPVPVKPAAKETVAKESLPSSIESPSKPGSKSVPHVPEKPGKPTPKPADDDEFDPVSFLMEGPKKKPVLEADPEPVKRSPMAGGPSKNGGGGGGFSLDDDNAAAQDFDAPPPTRKWGAKKDVSAAAAAERSMGGSKNAAKDLLARSMEESRVRASEMPEEQPKFNFDFSGFIREIGLKTGGMIAGIILGSIGLYWLMNNMMGKHLALPELGYVSGTVTMKGKPAAGIKVYFSPLNQEIKGASAKKERARDSTGVTNENGEFTLYYTTEVEGVAVGPSRLWMEALDPTVVIPPAYGMTSDHRVEVTKGNNPPQKIEL